MPYKDKKQQKQAQHESYLRNKDKIRVRVKKLRERNHIFIREYLLCNPCVDCGESDPIVLEFDHLRDKFREIGDLCAGGKIETIREEIKKCEVVCANCHKKRTAKKLHKFKNTLNLPTI